MIPKFDIDDIQFCDNTAKESIEAKAQVQAIIDAMQAQIEKLETLQTIAEDVNTWLIKNKLGGTAHQRTLAEALYALKVNNDTLLHTILPSSR